MLYLLFNWFLVITRFRLILFKEMLLMCLLSIRCYHSALFIFFYTGNFIMFSAIWAFASFVLHLVIIATITNWVLAITWIEFFFDIDKFNFAYFADVLSPRYSCICILVLRGLVSLCIFIGRWSKRIIVLMVLCFVVFWIGLVTSLRWFLPKTIPPLLTTWAIAFVGVHGVLLLSHRFSIRVMFLVSATWIVLIRMIFVSWIICLYAVHRLLIVVVVVLFVIVFIMMIWLMHVTTACLFWLWHILLLIKWTVSMVSMILLVVMVVIISPLSIKSLMIMTIEIILSLPLLLLSMSDSPKFRVLVWFLLRWVVRIIIVHNCSVYHVTSLVLCIHLWLVRMVVRLYPVVFLWWWVWVVRTFRIGWVSSVVIVIFILVLATTVRIVVLLVVIRVFALVMILLVLFHLTLFSIWIVIIFYTMWNWAGSLLVFRIALHTWTLGWQAIFSVWHRWTDFRAEICGDLMQKKSWNILIKPKLINNTHWIILN